MDVEDLNKVDRAAPVPILPHYTLNTNEEGKIADAKIILKRLFDQKTLDKPSRNAYLQTWNSLYQYFLAIHKKLYEERKKAQDFETREWIKDNKFVIGKHANQKFKDVCLQDPSYIQFLLNNESHNAALSFRTNVDTRLANQYFLFYAFGQGSEPKQSL
jgi:hypothetical protein